MAYSIYDITQFSVEDHPYYFCDSNVWISALKYFGNYSSNNYEIPYQTFIEAIINLNETQDPKLVKRIKNKPKLILTSLLLSEIINSYMRNVAMKAFYGNLDTYKSKNFKKDYRDEPNSDYRKELKNLCTDIIALSDYTILWPDEFDKSSPFNIISEMANNYSSDFNDFFYYKQFTSRQIPIVTNDGDFQFNDIDIITANSKLLKLNQKNKN